MSKKQLMRRVYEDRCQRSRLHRIEMEALPPEKRVPTVTIVKAPVPSPVYQERKTKAPNLKTAWKIFVKEVQTGQVAPPQPRPALPQFTGATFYGRRKQILKKLGFHSYESYLRSHKWFRIRAAVLTRDNSICLFCGLPATEVHHLAYDLLTLTGADLSRMYSTCSSCHEAVSYSSPGVLRSPTDMQAETERRLSQREAAISLDSSLTEKLRNEA